MNINISENISNRSEIVLTDIQFKNDYTDFVPDVRLQGSDNLIIKDKDKRGFVISLTREIQTQGRPFLTFMVSYDLIFRFNEPYADDTYMTDDELLDFVKASESPLIHNALARISVIISQISLHIGNGMPLISSPLLNHV